MIRKNMYILIINFFRAQNYNGLHIKPESEPPGAGNQLNFYRAGVGLPEPDAGSRTSGAGATQKVAAPRYCEDVVLPLVKICEEVLYICVTW